MFGQEALRGVFFCIVFVVKIITIGNHLVHQTVVYQADSYAALIVGTIGNDIANLLLNLLAGSYGTTEGPKHETKHRGAVTCINTNNSVDKEQTSLTNTHGFGVAVAKAGFFVLQVATVHIQRIGLPYHEGIFFQDFINSFIPCGQRIVITAPKNMSGFAVAVTINRVQLLPSSCKKVFVSVTILALCVRSSNGSNGQEYGDYSFFLHYPVLFGVQRNKEFS